MSMEHKKNDDDYDECSKQQADVFVRHKMQAMLHCSRSRIIFTLNAYTRVFDAQMDSLKVIHLNKRIQMPKWRGRFSMIRDVLLQIFNEWIHVLHHAWDIRWLIRCICRVVSLLHFTPNAIYIEEYVHVGFGYGGQFT